MGITIFSSGDFAQAPAVPEGFFVIGIFAKGSEQLFLMWQRDGRRSHFYDTYYAIDTTARRGVNLSARAGEHLDQALAAWEDSTDERVFYNIGKRVSDDALFGFTPEGIDIEPLRGRASRQAPPR